MAWVVQGIEGGRGEVNEEEGGNQVCGGLPHPLVVLVQV